MPLSLLPPGPHARGSQPSNPKPMVGATGEHGGEPMVGAAGFEPTTSASQTPRATKLRHAP
jgi:hypothetical protein